MHPIRLLVCAAVLALAAACGSAPTGPDHQALTATQFRAQANNICKNAGDATKRIVGNLTDHPTKAQIRQMLAMLTVVLDNEIDDLDRLVPPADMRAGMDTMLASARAGTDKFRKHGLKIVMRQNDVFKETNKDAVALGLRACAK